MEIYEVNMDGHRIVAFQIPPETRGIPRTWNGAAYAREDENYKSLSLIHIYASIIYNGNINQPVETVLQNSHLFSPMSSEVNNDTAFLDRVNAYLPGWEIKKFAPSNFTTHFGFSTDFFSELLKGLRKDTYYEVVDEFFSLGSHLKHCLLYTSSTDYY